MSELDAPRLELLALLHQSVMRTLLTDLGPSFIRRYYQIAATDASVIAYCLMTVNDELVGWVVGSPDPNALNARLRTPVGWFAQQLLGLAITRPAVFWQLCSSALSASPQMVTKGAVELTYIGIAPHARGRGLGIGLLRAFVDASRAAGYHAIELSVEKDNSAALGLYATFGFAITRTFREGRFERQRMVLVV